MSLGFGPFRGGGSGFSHDGFYSGHDVGVLRCQIVLFSDVGFQVE